MAGRARVGTSGWVYRHWRGVFYPAKLSQAHWFGYYANHYDTVEVNNSFYRLPSDIAFDHWREQAPAGFVYTLKASRLITHVHRLHNCAEPLATLLEGARRLGDHLGPVLYQLPPHFKADLQRLEEFASLLPPDLKHVFEFRDPAWFIEPVRELLARHNLAFCIYDMPGITCPRWVSGPIAYLRFHGSTKLYGGRYTVEELGAWARLARTYLAEGHDVYAYFNNDVGGGAVINAQELRGLLETEE